MANVDQGPSIRVLKWGDSHEKSQTRKVRGALAWVAVPTHQGRGYCRLVGKHGALGLGVWLAILELAACRPPDRRGVIKGTAEDVAIVSRLPLQEVDEVMPTLIAIGWIEVSRESEPTVLPACSQRTTSAVGARDHSTENGAQAAVNGGATSALPACSQRSGSAVGGTGQRGQTDREERETPLPPSRGGTGSLRHFPSHIRRFLRKGSAPKGYVSWGAYFASLAGLHDNSAEQACTAWLIDGGGQAAVDEAVARGLPVTSIQAGLEGSI